MIPKAAKNEGVLSPSSGLEMKKVGGRILVVDDEVLILNLIADVLKSEGYEVLTAQSAGWAMELFKRHLAEIDLVLADASISRQNGCELLKEMRTLKPGLRVVLSSGYVNEPSELDPLELGGTLFIGKPFDIKTLRQVVRRALSEE